MDASRYWALAEPPDYAPYGADTYGIVDEEAGGIVAYVHADNVKRLLRVLRRFEKKWDAESPS